MASIQSLLNKISDLASRTGLFSIQKGEFFGLLTDMINKVKEFSDNMNSVWKQLEWCEPVTTVADLTTAYGNTTKGLAAMVTTPWTDGVAYVYSCNGVEWKRTGLTAFPNDVIIKDDLRTKNNLADITTIPELIILTGSVVTTAQTSAWRRSDFLPVSLIGGIFRTYIDTLSKPIILYFTDKTLSSYISSQFPTIGYNYNSITPVIPSSAKYCLIQCQFSNIGNCYIYLNRLSIAEINITKINTITNDTIVVKNNLSNLCSIPELVILTGSVVTTGDATAWRRSDFLPINLIAGSFKTYSDSLTKPVILYFTDVTLSSYVSSQYPILAYNYSEIIPIVPITAKYFLIQCEFEFISTAFLTVNQIIQNKIDTENNKNIDVDLIKRVDVLEDGNIKLDLCSNKMTPGYMSQNGVLTPDSNFYHSDFLPFTDGVEIDCDIMTNSTIAGISFWNTLKQLISYQTYIKIDTNTSGILNAKVISPENTGFVVLSIRNPEVSEIVSSATYSKNTATIINEISNSITEIEKSVGTSDIIQYIYPSKIYTTCNDVIPTSKGRNRNYATSIFLDHLIDGLTEEKNLRFENGRTKLDFVAPMTVIDSNELTPGVQFNNGTNICEVIESHSLHQNGVNKGTLTIKHRSTLNSVTANKNLFILPIGDSILYAEQALVEDDNFTQNHGFHHICKELFVKDKVDNGGSGYNINFLGHFKKSKTINYKGADYNVDIHHEGFRGISLAQVLNAQTPDYVPYFHDANGNFSLATYLNNYRTLDNNGNRLTLGSGTGLLINSGNINDIDVCTPTHIVLMLGANDHGNVTLANYQTIINKIKSDCPTCIVGICTSEFGGTYFPSQYPCIPDSMAWWNNLEQGAGKGHSDQYKVQKFLQEYYDTDASENNGIYLVPFFYVLPPYSYAYRLSDNLNQQYVKAENNRIMQPYGWGYHIHINGIGHTEWGYQLYSWLKYTIVKNNL